MDRQTQKRDSISVNSFPHVLVLIYMLHDLKELDLSPAAAGFHVVVSGHSHKPLIETRQGVTYINPGSAGPRRFKLPVSVARLTIDGSSVGADRTFGVINPATGEIFAEAPDCTRAQLEAAMESAQQAFEDWRAED